MTTDTGAKFTKQQLEDATGVYEKYEAAIKGITQAQLEHDQAANKASMALALGPDKGGINAEQYKAVMAEIDKKLYESSEAFKNAKKAADDFNSFFDKNRATLQGITPEQDAYNESLKEYKKWLDAGKISKEGFVALEQKALDVLNKTAEKQNETNDIFKKYESYLTGMTEEAIKARDVQAELNSLVGKQVNGKTFTQLDVDTAMERFRKSLEESSEKAKDWNDTMKEVGKEAARNIQNAFADFLYDPFKDGLDGMVVDFANAMRKMVANILSSQILEYMGQLFNPKKTSSGTSGGSSGSGLDIIGILGSVGKWAGFFADGGYVAPGQWAVAGEAGAELVYGGNTGATVIPQGGASGGSATVNIINNNNSSVTANKRQTSNGIEIDVMIDEAVARKITTAGSRTNQALGAYSSRGLTRR